MSGYQAYSLIGNLAWFGIRMCWQKTPIDINFYYWVDKNTEQWAAFEAVCRLFGRITVPLDKAFDIFVIVGRNRRLSGFFQVGRHGLNMRQLP